MKRAWMAILCLSLLSGCTWVSQQWPWNRASSNRKPDQRIIKPIEQGPVAPGPSAAQTPVSQVDSRHAALTAVPVTGNESAPAQPIVASATSAVPAPETPAATESASSSVAKGPDGKPQVVDALMLIINNQVITVNEVIHPVRERLQAIPAGVTEEEFRAKARPILGAEVRRQVGETLVLKEADRFLSEDEKKQVDQELSEHIRDRIALMGGSKTRLDQELRKQGTTLQEATNVKRRELISRMYLRKKFLPQLNATRDQLWKYYENHPGEFSSPQKVQMQVLMLPYADFLPKDVDSPTPAELAMAKRKATAKAEEALRRIRDGEEFAKVVDAIGKTDSPEPGGVWDFMPAGSFREKGVEDVAFAQEIGQVSRVIQGQRGVYIVKTRDIQPGKVIPFELAQDDIDKKIRDKQYDDLTTEYFSKLAAKANIVQAEEFEKMILDRSVQQYYRPHAENQPAQ